MNVEKFAKLLDLLKDQHSWPGYYTYKFILKSEMVSQILVIFPDEEVTQRQSEKGNYVSISVKKFFNTPEEVIEYYEKVSLINGVMVL